MRITLSDNTKLSEIIRRIAESSDDQVYLSVADDSLFDRHRGNVQLIQKIARDLGRSVVIEKNQTDQAGQMDQTKEVSVKHDLDATVPSGSEAVKPPAQDTSGSTKTSTTTTRMLSPRKIIVFFLILLILGMGGAGAYVFYYLPRGTVTLYVAERVLERSLTVRVDPAQAAVDLENKTVPGQQVTVEFEETQTFSATGTKTVGDKATGTVEIRNFTETQLQLPAGTVLTAGGGSLSYTLVQSVAVPAATETLPDETTRVFEAGIAEALVEASEIGETHNLPLGTTFRVSEYQVKDVSAVSATTISGGSTREETVVTQTDQNTAQEQLRVKVFAQAKDRLKEQVPDGYSFSEDSINNSTNFAQFSQAIDAEADKFDLTLKTQSSVIAYRLDDLKTLLQQDIGANIPDGFELSEENMVVKVEQAEMVDGKLQVKAKISALVVPTLDLGMIGDRLVSKTPIEGESILRGIEQIQGYDVRLWPALPDPVKRFPHIRERLELKVEVKD